MTTLIVSGFALLLIAGTIWALIAKAKREGRAEAERAAIEAAKETEEAMEEITSQPRDPEKTKRELEGGTF